MFVETRKWTHFSNMVLLEKKYFCVFKTTQVGTNIVVRLSYTLSSDIFNNHVS